MFAQGQHLAAGNDPLDRLQQTFPLVVRLMTQSQQVRQG